MANIHIIRWINKLPVTNFFFPNRCICCDSILKIDVWPPICDKCDRELKPYVGERCHICDRPIEHSGVCSACNELKRYYDKGYCVFSYEDRIRLLLLKCKYGEEPRYCDFFGKRLYECIGSDIMQYDIITSVPIHIKKQRQRGYNQAELIAMELSDRSGVEYKVLLKRKVETKPQSQLSKQERSRNVKGAFEPTDTSIKGKRVLIVDDILTTGATANECSKMLKRMGASMVGIAALGAVNPD